MKTFYLTFLNRLFRAILPVFAFFFLLNQTSAGTITSKAVTGNWSSASSWVGGVVPASTDNVVIAAGANITANQNYSTASGSPSLTVNGTLTLTGNGTISLLNFTTVVITCPGQIYWSQNANLVFSAGTSVEVNNYTNGSTCGLQPTGGSASAALVIGGVTIAVSNDNSNNAAYSFDEFNKAGGLAAFLLSGTSPICYASTFTLTLTCTDNATNFDCSWSIDQGTFSNNSTTLSASGFTTSTTATVKPINTTTAKTYTINCTITRHGDGDPITTKTITITVNPTPTISSTSPTTQCLGSAASIAATATGVSSYQWQLSTDGGSSWSDLSNNSTYSNTTTQTLGVSSTNITMASYYYRIKINGISPCGTATSGSVPLQFTNEWLGTNSKSWATTGNWINNQLPNTAGTCPTITIPSGTTFSPQLDQGRAYQNISISPGANLDLNGNTLEIDGTFTGSATGYLKGSAASGLIIGGAATNLYFDPANNILKTLTMKTGSTATLGNALTITAGTYASPGTVTANSGSTLTSNGYLTLKSNSLGDARVASSTGTISGTVTVERFIPARRAWRFITSPFNTTSLQTINSSWQEGQTNTSIYVRSNLVPHYGTEITYNGVNGYDPNATSNPSIKVWSNQTWAALPGTSNTYITDYPAYCLFVRGSRAVDLSSGTSATADSTTLRATGVLNETGVTVSKSLGTYSNGNFVFIGNPFASTIDLSSVLGNCTGINTTKFWAWDPGAPGTYNVGDYVTYSVGTGISVPNGSTYSGGKYAQSGQGFFVQATGGSVTAKFKQSDKAASETNVFSKVISSNGNPYPVIYVNLKVAPSDSLVLIDGVGTVFGNKFSSDSDEYDAQKLWNFDENIALVRNTKTLAIEFRPVPALKDTLFYRLYLRQQPYTLQIFTKDFSGMPLMRAWMVDKYLNTKTEINLQDTTLYPFTPNPDTNSYRNRFMLVLNRQLQTIPVAVTKTTNEANPNIKGVANSMAAASGNISLYPNLITEGENAMIRFNKMNKGNYEITVYSSEGKKIHSQKIQDDGGTNLYTLQSNSALAAGVYAITVLNESSKKLVTLKLAVTK